MPRQSCQTVTYKDLISFAEKALVASEKKLAGAKAVGAYSLEGLTHEAETGKMLVKMLKKGVKEKQTDFLELFESAKK